MASSRQYCYICDQEIENHDSWLDTDAGPAHQECLELDEEDLDQ